LIHETKDRWIYAIAFGALTELFLQLILEENLLSVVDYSAATIVNNVFKGNMRYIIHMTKLYVHNRACAASDCNDLSTGILHSFCFHSWISSDHISHYRICLCFGAVSELFIDFMLFVTLCVGRSKELCSLLFTPDITQ